MYTKLARPHRMCISGEIGNSKDSTPGGADGGPGGLLRKFWSLQILLSVNNLYLSVTTTGGIYFMWI